MIVVADTSPLNYLVLVGHIEILAKIYGEVVVPQTVLDELQDNDAPAEVRAWFSAPPAWLQVSTLIFRRDPSWIDWTAVSRTQFCWRNHSRLSG